MRSARGIAAMLVLAALLAAASWAIHAGKLPALAGATSAKLREATVAGLTEGPYGTMTREMAERVYQIMRKKPEQRTPEETAWAYNALRWTGQFERAEEFVAPWARSRMQFIRQNFESHPDKFYILRADVELGALPGSANPDRAVAVVTGEYWGLPSQKTREEKGIAAVGQRWKERVEYQLVRQGGLWWVEEPIGKGLGGWLLEEATAWPPLQPWPPR